MSTRKVLTLASMAAMLFAPAAFGFDSLPDALDSPFYVLGESQDSGLGDLSPSYAAAESDEYFASRPLGSRLSATISPQSEPVESREALETRLEEASKRFRDSPPRPAQWGGYRLAPERFEFWQGRKDRLHDRLCYRRAGSAWKIERLAP